MQVISWGGMARQAASLVQPAFSSAIRGRLLGAGRDPGSKCLVIGNLRSYGDHVLCPDGNYIQTTRCDRILGIDAQRQTATAESGVRLNVLQQRLPLGFMIPARSNRRDHSRSSGPGAIRQLLCAAILVADDAVHPADSRKNLVSSQHLNGVRGCVSTSR